MPGSIHIKVSNSIYERWQQCCNVHGQRSQLLRRAVLKIIEYLEEQKKLTKEINLKLD